MKRQQTNSFIGMEPAMLNAKVHSSRPNTIPKIYAMHPADHLMLNKFTFLPTTLASVYAIPLTFSSFKAMQYVRRHANLTNIYTGMANAETIVNHRLLLSRSIRPTTLFASIHATLRMITTTMKPRHAQANVSHQAMPL